MIFIIRFKEFVYVNDKDVALEFTYKDQASYQRDLFRFLAEGYVLETYITEEE